MSSSRFQKIKYYLPRGHTQADIVRLIQYVNENGRTWKELSDPHFDTSTPKKQDTVRMLFDRIVKQYKKQGLTELEDILAFYEWQEAQLREGPHQESETQEVQGKTEQKAHEEISIDLAPQERLDEEFTKRNLNPEEYEIKEIRFGDWGNEDNPNEQFRVTVKPKPGVAQAFPVVHPIEANIPFNRPTKPKQDKALKKALIIPDSQNGYATDLSTGRLDPFHDRRCWDLALQLADHEQPDVIVLLGDMLDLPDWSDKFIRSPEFAQNTQPAINELHWWLTRLRQICPDAEITYIEGNHEIRIVNAIKTNLKAAFYLKPADRLDGPEIYSVPNLLGFESLGIEWVGDYPDGRVWLNDNYYLCHGTIAKAGPGQSAGGVVIDARSSSGNGHNHRLEMASKTVFARRGSVTYRSFSFGTLAKIPGRTPAKSKENNWQNALGLVSYEPGNGLFEVYPLFISEGRLLWDNKRFEGQDPVERIRKDLDCQLY